MTEAQKQVQSDAPPGNVLSLDAERHRYESDYLQRAFNLPQGQLEAPIENRCNGNYAALRAIHGVHANNGPAAARESAHIWLPTLTPELAALIEPQRLRAFPARDCLTYPDVRWLVPKIIPEQSYIVASGKPGSFKSFWSFDIGMTLACQGRKVVIINTEGRKALKKRIQAWCKHHNCDVPEMLYIVDNAVAIDDDLARAELITVLQPINPDLLIIDPLANCFNGEENSNSEIGRFNRGCNQLQRELQTAVLVIHHTVKSGEGYRGGSALEGAADVMLEISNDDGLITVKNTKNKDEENQPSLYFRALQIEVGHDPELDEPITSCVLHPSDKVMDTPDDKLTETEQTVIAALALSSFDAGAKTADLRGVARIGSPSTFYHVLSRLKDKGFIQRDGKYEPWLLTEAGKAIARQYGLTSSNSNPTPKEVQGSAQITTSSNSNLPLGIGVEGSSRVGSGE